MKNDLVSALAQGDQTQVVLIGSDNENTLTSLEVAEMVEVEHAKLLRSIRTYCEYLAEANFGLGQYFIESTYFDANHQSRPCFQVTKKGCEMIANKLTGPKGIIFTAKYIERFHSMENYIKERQVNTSQLSPQLQALSQMVQAMATFELNQKQLQNQVQETKQEVQSMRDTLLLDHDSWRGECNKLINKVAKQRGGTKEAYEEVRNEIYELVNKRAGADLKKRVTYMKDRLRREGITKSKIDKVSQIDVIAADKKVKEIYIAIVKEMAIKYSVY